VGGTAPIRVFGVGGGKGLLVQEWGGGAGVDVDMRMGKPLLVPCVHTPCPAVLGECRVPALPAVCAAVLQGCAAKPGGGAQGAVVPDLQGVCQGG